jgi:hypothetical protein
MDQSINPAVAEEVVEVTTGDIAEETAVEATEVAVEATEATEVAEEVTEAPVAEVVEGEEEATV